MENMLFHVFFCLVVANWRMISAEQLFGVELRSEADCEYPLDMRLIGQKRSVYVIHRQMCFLLTEIYLEFYGFLESPAGV